FEGRSLFGGKAVGDRIAVVCPRSGCFAQGGGKGVSMGTGWHPSLRCKQWRGKRLLEPTSDLVAFEGRSLFGGKAVDDRIAVVCPRSGCFVQGGGKGASMGTRPSVLSNVGASACLNPLRTLWHLRAGHCSVEKLLAIESPWSARIPLGFAQARAFLLLKKKSPSAG
ncbi:MAG: hypothetical protein O2964_09070, partial [Verrucomicrobia bacterium]|nr:hypothetical protein [Verrucomicrobiota bacterium]